MNIYDNFIDRKKLYQEIFFIISDKTVSMLKANTIITKLGLDEFIGYFNSLEKLQDLDTFAQKYFRVSIGQIVVSFMFFVLVVLFKKLVVDTLLFSFTKVLYKGIKDSSKNERFRNYMDSSLRLPIRYILYLIALDISLRILFMSIDNGEVINYFTLLYILIFIWGAFRLINNFVLMYSDDVLVNYPNIRGEMINFFVNFFKLFVLVVGLLIIFSSLGYDVSGVIASLGIGGLAVAFAARETIANIFGSISLILDNTFTQGDWIVMDEAEGTVVDIGMRSTKIRTFDNAMIYVPNSEVASAKVKNWSRRMIGRRIYMKIGATYSSKPSDLKNAIDEIKEMLVNHPQIADSNFNEDEKNLSLVKTKVVSANLEYGIIKTLLVNLDELSDSSINIMIYCFSKSVIWSEWLEVKEDVVFKIMEIFEKNNLSFAFPSQSVYIEENDSGVIAPTNIDKVEK
ncbi:MAG: mechanosensitive ion channel family protein [Sulfurimonas sp.]|nr:mechanosensitive ion channel family protein [Sulfurimonas sp.]